MRAVSREVDRTPHESLPIARVALGDIILKGEMYLASSEEVIGPDERQYFLMLKPDYDQGMFSIW